MYLVQHHSLVVVGMSPSRDEIEQWWLVDDLFVGSTATCYPYIYFGALSMNWDGSHQFKKSLKLPLKTPINSDYIYHKTMVKPMYTFWWPPEWFAPGRNHGYHRGDWTPAHGRPEGSQCCFNGRQGFNRISNVAGTSDIHHYRWLS